jgi:hypothetical protein
MERRGFERLCSHLCRPGGDEVSARGVVRKRVRSRLLDSCGIGRSGIRALSGGGKVFRRVYRLYRTDMPRRLARGRAQNRGRVEVESRPLGTGLATEGGCERSLGVRGIRSAADYQHYAPQKRCLAARDGEGRARVTGRDPLERSQCNLVRDRPRRLGSPEPKPGG